MPRPRLPRQPRTTRKRDGRAYLQFLFGGIAGFGLGSAQVWLALPGLVLLLASAWGMYARSEP